MNTLTVEIDNVYNMFISQIKRVTEQCVDNYINKISTKYNIDKNELKDLWNKIETNTNDDNSDSKSVKSDSKSVKSDSKSEKSEVDVAKISVASTVITNAKTCIYKLTKGKTPGKYCGSKITGNSLYCSKHKKYEIAEPPKQKKIIPKPREDVDLNCEEDEPINKLSIQPPDDSDDESIPLKKKPKMLCESEEEEDVKKIVKKVSEIMGVNDTDDDKPIAKQSKEVKTKEDKPVKIDDKPITKPNKEVKTKEDKPVNETKIDKPITKPKKEVNEDKTKEDKPVKETKSKSTKKATDTKYLEFKERIKDMVDERGYMHSDKFEETLYNIVCDNSIPYEKTPMLKFHYDGVFKLLEQHKVIFEKPKKQVAKQMDEDEIQQDDIRQDDIEDVLEEMIQNSDDDYIEEEEYIRNEEEDF